MFRAFAVHLEYLTEFLDERKSPVWEEYLQNEVRSYDSLRAGSTYELRSHESEPQKSALSRLRRSCVRPQKRACRSYKIILGKDIEHH